MVRWWCLLLGGSACAFAQNAAAVRVAAHDFAAQPISPALTAQQRGETAKLQQQAERETEAGRYGEALRNYAHATAVVRNAQWTPAVELAASVELRVEHVLLEPGRPVTLSLGRLYPVAESAEAKLTASIWLSPTSTQAQTARELMRAVAIEPTRVPFSTQVSIPEIPRPITIWQCASRQWARPCLKCWKMYSRKSYRCTSKNWGLKQQSFAAGWPARL